jgi:hypothetical protein
MTSTTRRQTFLQRTTRAALPNGRPKAYWPKVFLTKAGITGARVQADLDSAKYYAADVINNSGLSLFPDYYDAFLTLNKNNPEMLFGLQFTVAAGADWTTNDFRQTAIEGDAEH